MASCKEMNMACLVWIIVENVATRKMVVDAGCYGRNVCTPCNLKL